MADALATVANKVDRMEAQNRNMNDHQQERSVVQVQRVEQKEETPMVEEREEHRGEQEDGQTVWQDAEDAEELPANGVELIPHGSSAR